MSNDDEKKPKPANDFEQYFADLADRAKQREDHLAKCSAVPCPVCGRYECRGCNVVYLRDEHDHELCGPCRAKSFRRAWTSPALASIPSAFAAASLDAAWLIELVGARAIALARGSLSAPRVAFVGDAGSGKTSLAIAMFRAAVMADAPPPPRDWAPGMSRDERFGSKHLYVSAFALAKARGQAPMGREVPLIERALAAPLVLIDELGGEDPRYASAVTEVIYERHAEGRATWITMGVDAERIAQRYGGGIARKALEEAVEVKLGRKAA